MCYLKTLPPPTLGSPCGKLRVIMHTHTLGIYIHWMRLMVCVRCVCVCVFFVRVYMQSCRLRRLPGSLYSSHGYNRGLDGLLGDLIALGV